VRRESECLRTHCWTRCWYSRSTSSCLAATIDGFGRITTSRCGAPDRLNLRKASRSRLFTAFRVTAPPTRRLTAKPRRSRPSRFSMATREKSRPSRRPPRLSARRKSAPATTRSWRRRVARGEPPTASRPEPLPTLLPTPLQHQPAALGAHPYQETMSPLTFPVVRLERPFHRSLLPFRTKTLVY
jgi:hypothetical protein